MSIDFSKAFDCVKRETLINLLREKLFDDAICSWTDNFLSNRVITFSGEGFSYSKITSEGLPQGSCLSPILFNIYTAKLHDLESESVKIFQFADDFNLLISTDKKDNISEVLMGVLNKFMLEVKRLNFE